MIGTNQTIEGFKSNGQEPNYDFDISDKDFSNTDQGNNEPPVLEVLENIESTTTPETVVTEPVVIPVVESGVEANTSNEKVEQEVVTVPVQTQVTAEINDDSVFNYLSGKLGKEVKTLDDLIPQSVNPLDSDPYLKNLVEWRNKTGRPLEDWAKYQKNYDEMSDIDVVRESLQLKYPMLTPDEIDSELSKFIPDEDEDTPQEIRSKNIEIKKFAHDGRTLLNELKSDLGKPSEGFGLSEEQKSDLELARQYKESQAGQSQAVLEYSNNVKQASFDLGKVSLKLSDTLSIDYNVSEQTKKELPDFINTMPHWRNADGGMNFKAVAEDSLKIKHFDDIMKIVFEQGLSAGKDEVLKTTNNVNLTEPNRSQVVDTNAPIVEGLDRMFGLTNNKIRFK